MSRSTRASTLARRDAGLRRLRTLNRVLIGTAVAGTGLLTDVAAHAFPGHKRPVTARAATTTAAATSTRASRRHRRHRVRHHAHPALRAPAHAPTTATHSAPAPAVTTSAPQPAVTTSAPQPAVTSSAPQPAPAPAPAPAVSGGS